MMPTVAKLIPKTDTALEDLNEGRQQCGDREGERQRFAGALQHAVEPGLLRQRCRGLLEQHQAEDDQGSAEERRRYGPVPRQPLAHHDRAGDSEHVERDHLDVEGDDHDERRYADAPAKNQRQRSLRRDQA